MANEDARRALRRLAAQHPEALSLINRYLVSGDPEIGDQVANLLSVNGVPGADGLVRDAAGGTEAGDDENEPEA